jgi:acyl-CoA thioesterase I
MNWGTLVNKHIAVTALSLALGIGALAPASAFECAVPRHVAPVKFKLPVFEKALHENRDVVIVAMGSSSTQGIGASEASKSYPSQLAALLATHWPNQHIRVINSGVNGDTETDMLARFQRDLIDYHPDLVIWQVGSNTIMKGVPLSTYMNSLLDGITQIKTIKADLILMNPQFSPAINVHPETPHLLDAMRNLSAEHNINLFQRYEIMRYWLNNDYASLDDMIARDGLHMRDSSYHCLADVLATKIEKSVHEPRLIAAHERRPQ